MMLAGTCELKRLKCKICPRKNMLYFMDHKTHCQQIALICFFICVRGTGISDAVFFLRSIGLLYQAHLVPVLVLSVDNKA